jgi:serine/threonine-protein kinase
MFGGQLHARMGNERTSFGKYHVLARLGAGGMGQVYLAVGLGPAGVQKLVVVKQLREDLASSLAARSMFLDEARTAMRLNHPNIVQTNEVVDEGDDLYLVMEFLDGQPLARMLEERYAPRLTLSGRVRIIAEALAGLDYAHELTDFDGTPLNVVHRDVSPHNIVVTYDGHVKLVDFGVAKAADSTTVTGSGVFKGKIRYAAPEQVLCAKIDRRADIFAVGTLLWEAISNRRMWRDMSDASIMLALASGKIPDLREFGSDAPPELASICTKALAVDPATRFATANEMRGALLDWLKRVDDKTDLGALVRGCFGKDRAELRVVIDTQIKTVRESSSGALTMRRIPVFQLDPGTMSDATVGAIAPPSRRPMTQPPPHVTSSTPIVVAVAAVGLLLGGAVFLGASRRPSGADLPPAAAAPSPSETRVHLSLRASPPSARFVLDGKPLDANPYEGDVVRDDAQHSLSVVADGFQSRDLDARFARDVHVDVALTPAPPPLRDADAKANVAPRPAPAPPPRNVGATFNPGASNTRPTKPNRGIDEEDPYR